MAGLTDEVSFERGIRPLFRDKDHDAMDWLLDLWSYEDVKANAAEILAQLQAGPCPVTAPGRPSRSPCSSGGPKDPWRRRRGLARGAGERGGSN
jgi:hypothetical protein